MTMPKNPAKEIMERTMANCWFIQQQVPVIEGRKARLRLGQNVAQATDEIEGPYEVTQLLGSFLGALVHPWEKLRKEVRTDLSCNLVEAQRRGWPVPVPEWPGNRSWEPG